MFTFFQTSLLFQFPRLLVFDIFSNPSYYSIPARLLETREKLTVFQEEITGINKFWCVDANSAKLKATFLHVFL